MTISPSTAGQGLASELTRKSFQNASIKIGIFSNAQLYKLVFQDGHLGLSHGINYLLPQQFLQSLISAVLCVPNFGLWVDLPKKRTKWNPSKNVIPLQQEQQNFLSCLRNSPGMWIPGGWAWKTLVRSLQGCRSVIRLSSELYQVNLGFVRAACFYIVCQPWEKVIQVHSTNRFLFSFQWIFNREKFRWRRKVEATFWRRCLLQNRENGAA